MTLVYSPDRPVSQSDLLALYGSVGWSSYTRDPAGLHRAVAGSLWRMGAWDGPELVGLVRAVGDGLGGLEGLDLGLDRARGEADHAGDLQALGDVEGQHRGGHAHREGAGCGALLDDAGHVRLGCLGLEDRVVNHRGHVTLVHGTTFLSHHSWARGRASSIMVVKDV